MRINQVRRILEKRHQEVSEDLQKKMERYKLTAEQVMQQDLFLAGQMYMISMISLDWIIEDDQTRSVNADS